MNDGRFMPRERNDCAVWAVSVVTGVPYRQVYGLFKWYGRRKNGGSKQWMTPKVLGDLGWGVVNVTGQYRGRTVKTLVPELEPHLRFLVRTYCHILAVRNGKAEDWTQGRLHRVKTIMRVVPLPKNQDD